MHGLFRSHTGRTVNLADHHAFRAIDHKRTGGGHQRDFAHVDALFTHLVAIFQAEGHVKRRGEGRPFIKAVHTIHLRRGKLILDKIKDEPPVIAFQRENLLENCLQSLPLAADRIRLHLKEILI